MPQYYSSCFRKFFSIMDLIILSFSSRLIFYIYYETGTIITTGDLLCYLFLNNYKKYIYRYNLFSRLTSYQHFMSIVIPRGRHLNCYQVINQHLLFSRNKGMISV